MFKNFRYILMAGIMLATFGWIRQQVTSYDPGASTPVAAAVNTRVWAAETMDLVDFVTSYRATTRDFSMEWPPLESMAYAGDTGASALLDELHVGMTRDDVKLLLGEPYSFGNDMGTWVYDVATVVFDGDAVAGWLDTSDAQSMKQSLRDVMAPLVAPTTREPEAASRRPWPVPTTYRSGSAGASTGSYRRPLDRLFHRRSTVDRYYSGTHRKPEYLREMFRHKQQGRRNGAGRPYNDYRY